MEPPELILADAAVWRAWLAEHHDNPTGVWLVLAKKGTARPTSLSYDQALDEALCHGWIDGQSQRRDETTYLQRFTARRVRSPWSARNVGIVARLVAEGRMHPAGLAEVERAKADGRWEAAYAGSASIDVPPDLAVALAAQPSAQAMFDILTRQNRYAVLYRIGSAKRADTRARRIEQFVAMLARGETVYPQKKKLDDVCGRTGMDPVATTGLYTAVMRARESARPDRLFSDPFAEVLAGPQGQDLLAWMDKQSPGSSQNPIISIRTRFFDDALERILGEPEVDQLVILAAGLDTRAFRLPLRPELALFELDRAEVLDLKAARLAPLDATPQCRRIPIPADLTGDWSAALRDGGFDPQRPSAWLVEGLLQYITETQVHHVLSTLSGLAAPGSRLLTDLVSRTFFTSPQLAGFLAMMAANGSPWHFGTDDPEGLFAGHGWQPRVTRVGDDAANFGRWIMPPGYYDDPDSMPHGFLVVAHR